MKPHSCPYCHELTARVMGQDAIFHRKGCPTFTMSRFRDPNVLHFTLWEPPTDEPDPEPHPARGPHVPGP